MKNIVIYHDDPDGFTSAWVIWRDLGDCMLIPAEYNSFVLDMGVMAGNNVYMVDFSLPRDELLQLEKHVNSLVVIDHHKTAQDELGDLPFAIYDMERSGAGLTWDTFHPNEPRPWLVDYVEDRDLWRFELPSSKIINAYIASQPLGDVKAWDRLASMPLDYVTAMGIAILDHIQEYVRCVLKSVRHVNFHDCCIAIVNAPYVHISEVLGELQRREPESVFVLGWSQEGDGRYKYSLRSNGLMDISAIAKFYGGGGHARAAGFILDRFLF